MVRYWLDVLTDASWKSLLVFFDDPLKGIGAFVLLAFVTLVVVRLIRSKEAFREHWISNIAIPSRGGAGGILGTFQSSTDWCETEGKHAFQLIARPPPLSTTPLWKISTWFSHARTSSITALAVERRLDAAFSPSHVPEKGRLLAADSDLIAFTPNQSLTKQQHRYVFWQACQT